jgi:hypothetical protein
LPLRWSATLPRNSMHLPFEQIDEAAGEDVVSIVAGIEALDLPDAGPSAPPIATLNQNNRIAAATFARRVTEPVIFIGLAVQTMPDILAAHRRRGYSWPFGFVEAIWCVVAVRRWWVKRRG